MSSSTAIRVLRGSRSLLAAAKSSSTSTPAAGTKSKAKAKTKEGGDVVKPKRIVTTGIQKPQPISPALGSFVGATESSRAQAVKQIWAYIKLHNLQNPANKREINCDATLKTLFEGKDTVNMLEIAKLLSNHFVKTA